MVWNSVRATYPSVELTRELDDVGCAADGDYCLLHWDVADPCPCRQSLSAEDVTSDSVHCPAFQAAEEAAVYSALEVEHSAVVQAAVQPCPVGNLCGIPAAAGSRRFFLASLDRVEDVAAAVQGACESSAAVHASQRLLKAA